MRYHDLTALSISTVDKSRNDLDKAFVVLQFLVYEAFNSEREAYGLVLEVYRFLFVLGALFDPAGDVRIMLHDQVEEFGQAVQRHDQQHKHAGERPTERRHMAATSHIEHREGLLEQVDRVEGVAQGEALGVMPQLLLA